MSGTIVQQPPTSGKVILNTSMGQLEIELWCKEIPKATRNFIQLCSEGYYDNTIFHRLIPQFMIQGGDPTGTGKGGESIYGKPFQDEFHQRLTFQQRGTLAMANAGPHDNGSQFFITFDACPWLDKKHTIFGKIVGNTIYNLMQIGQVDTDHDDRPLIPIKIIDTQVVINPFDDILVRNIPKKVEEQQQPQKKVTQKGVKNTSLLSFQEDEEEEEEVEEKVIQSIHDVINDPKLKKQEAVSKQELEEKRRKRMEEEQKKEQLKQRIRNKDHQQDEQAQEDIVKKRKLNKNIDMSEYLKNEEDKDLLNYRIVRNERQQIELVPLQEEEEDQESSEYIEDEEKRLERMKQKEQYENLKAEILQFKKYQLGTYNEELISRQQHEKKLMSNVEKRRLKYVQNKRSQLHEDDINARLAQFKSLKESQEVKSDKYHWLNNKLKFHIDSANAYNQNSNKEKVSDYYALEEVSIHDTKTEVQNKQNINLLLQLSSK